MYEQRLLKQLKELNNERLEILKIIKVKETDIQELESQLTELRKELVQQRIFLNNKEKEIFERCDNI